ncbi:peptidase inhibitor family I36 protein [Streptomyces sp. NPDC005962]|uniref:peptidase inhibitor family I36 protein n=1 Tax=Streptomyces sp. NPDC005962 TaxID=3154466 RepID=UPI0034023819
MRTTRLALVATNMAAVVAVLTLPGAASATETQRNVCPTGYFCAYPQTGWQGQECKWDVADPDWTSGIYKCSWAASKPVKSVYNNGTSSATGVAFYLNKNYGHRVGCTRKHSGGNLVGDYKVKSHKWISGSCG